MSNKTAKSPMARLWTNLRHGRTMSQLLFTGLTVWIGAQMISDTANPSTIERYCPFGGVETLLPWLKGTGTLCSLSTVNISVLAGVLLITVLFKRAFCSHICPFGAVSEWTAKLGRYVPSLPLRVPRKLDRALKWLKYPVLALILFLTYHASELVFRAVDPYYVLFTFGQGHEIAGYSMALGVETFVQEHRAVIKYDAAALSTSQIQQKIEQPVQFKDGTVVKPFTLKEILK